MNQSQLLTEEQVQLITQPTPTEHVEFRPWAWRERPAGVREDQSHDSDAEPKGSG